MTVLAIYNRYESILDADGERIENDCSHVAYDIDDYELEWSTDESLATRSEHDALVKHIAVMLENDGCTEYSGSGARWHDPDGSHIFNNGNGQRFEVAVSVAGISDDVVADIRARLAKR